MSGLVPRSSRTAPERRIAGSAFTLGGLALAVAPLSAGARRTTVGRIPGQRSGDAGVAEAG